MIGAILVVCYTLYNYAVLYDRGKAIDNMKAHAVDLGYGRYDVDPYGKSTFHWNPPSTNYPPEHPLMKKTYVK
jgi:hypothetical protein